MELKDLTLFQYLVKQNFHLASQVESVYTLTKETIDGISGSFPNYTMHNTGHSLRVARYMGELSCGLEEDGEAYRKNLSRYNAFEVALMLLSAILHDIGMYIRPSDRAAIRKNEIAHGKTLSFQAVVEEKGGSEEEAIKEIIRQTHGDRVEDFMNVDFGGGQTIAGHLRLDNFYDYGGEVVKICAAHGKDHSHLKTLPAAQTLGDYSYNPRFLASLLRIADYMDIDRRRIPTFYQAVADIQGYSKEEWAMHHIVQNHQKLQPYLDNNLQIVFRGISKVPSLHRRYLSYVDRLRRELEQTDELLNRKDAKEKYRFRITPKVEDLVNPDGFACTDLRLNLDYRSIMELLMGNNLYDDKSAGLRELIQNCIDACQIRREAAEKSGDFYEPRIILSISKEKGYVKVRDNGIGMTYDVIRDYFLNIGNSYYRSSEFRYQNCRYKPIGKFGIGFLACFLLSDHVVVKTSHYESRDVYEIGLERNSEYILTQKQALKPFEGTQITLEYDRFFKVFKSTDKLLSFLKETFALNFPILVKDDDTHTVLLEYAIDYEDKLKQMLTRDNKDWDNYEAISCDGYSDVLEGCMLYWKQTQEVQLKQLPAGRTYILDMEKGALYAVPDPKTLETGFYRLWRYAHIREEEYEAICGITSDYAERRHLMLRDREHFYFLTKVEQDIFMNRPGRKDVAGILEGSPFRWRREFFPSNMLYDSFPSFELILVMNGYRLKIHRNSTHRRHKYTTLFHKGIFISKISGYQLTLPIRIPIMCINYTGSSLSLNVSRSRIQGKDRSLDRILNVLILKQLRKREPDPASVYCKMLSWLIAYFEDTKNPLTLRKQV